MILCAAAAAAVFRRTRAPRRGICIKPFHSKSRSYTMVWERLFLDFMAKTTLQKCNFLLVFRTLPGPGGFQCAWAHAVILYVVAMANAFTGEPYPA